jgi:hypothetical protein
MSLNDHTVEREIVLGASTVSNLASHYLPKKEKRSDFD